MNSKRTISIFFIILIFLSSYFVYNKLSQKIPSISTNNSTSLNVENGLKEKTLGEKREGEIRLLNKMGFGKMEILLDNNLVKIYSFEKLKRKIIYIKDINLGEYLIENNNGNAFSSKFINFIDGKSNKEKKEFIEEMNKLKELLKNDGLNDKEIETIINLL